MITVSSQSVRWPLVSPASGCAKTRTTHRWDLALAASQPSTDQELTSLLGLIAAFGELIVMANQTSKMVVQGQLFDV